MFKVGNASGFTVLIDLAEQIGNGLGFVGRYGKVGFVCAVGEGCAVGFSKVESDGVGARGKGSYFFVTCKCFFEFYGLFLF